MERGFVKPKEGRRVKIAPESYSDYIPEEGIITTVTPWLRRREMDGAIEITPVPSVPVPVPPPAPSTKSKKSRASPTP